MKHGSAVMTIALALVLGNLPGLAAAAVDVLVVPGPTACVGIGPSVSVASSIQDAVDAASPGDTVAVCPGTYVEQVVVNKPLTLLALGAAHVVGSPGPGPKFGFDVTSDDVTIRDFDVSGFEGAGSCGIRFQLVDRITIHRNDIHHNSRGVCAAVSTASHIVRNSIHDNQAAGGGLGVGISTNELTDGDISGNTISGHTGRGMLVLADRGTTIAYNVVTDTADVGIDVFGSQGTAVRNNTVRDNGAPGFGGGLLINATTGVVIDHNSLRDNSIGVVVVNSSSCQVRSNTASMNIRHGIFAGGLSSCVVSHNIANTNGLNGILAVAIGGGDAFTCNGAVNNGPTDCSWDGTGVPAPSFAHNVCGTENPPGVWGQPGSCQ